MVCFTRGKHLEHKVKEITPYLVVFEDGKGVRLNSKVAETVAESEVLTAQRDEAAEKARLRKQSEEAEAAMGALYH